MRRRCRLGDAREGLPTPDQLLRTAHRHAHEHEHEHETACSACFETLSLRRRSYPNAATNAELTAPAQQLCRHVLTRRPMTMQSAGADHDLRLCKPWLKPDRLRGFLTNLATAVRRPIDCRPGAVSPYSTEKPPPSLGRQSSRSGRSRCFVASLELKPQKKRMCETCGSGSRPNIRNRGRPSLCNEGSAASTSSALQGTKPECMEF